MQPRTRGYLIASCVTVLLVGATTWYGVTHWGSSKNTIPTLTDSLGKIEAPTGGSIEEIKMEGIDSFLHSVKVEDKFFANIYTTRENGKEVLSISYRGDAKSYEYVSSLLNKLGLEVSPKDLELTYSKDGLHKIGNYTLESTKADLEEQVLYNLIVTSS